MWFAPYRLFKDEIIFYGLKHLSEIFYIFIYLITIFQTLKEFYEYKQYTATG